MENTKDIYYMRVIPLVRKITKIENKKEKTIIVDNLSREEIKNMSCEPRMLEKDNNNIYFTELPLNYHGSKIRWSLFYLYEELNDIEKEKYSSRTMYIPVTVESVVRLYVNKIKKKEK